MYFSLSQRLQLVYELRERNPLIPFSLQSLRFPQVAEVSDSWIALVSKGTMALHV